MPATIGTIISGTMRNEDLVPAFMAELDNLKEDLSLSVKPGEELATSQRVGNIDTLLGDIEQRMVANGYYESEECHFDLESLFDALESFAPDGCYFGAHAGDCCDYGFWRYDDYDN